MALDTFNPYLFVSAGEQFNKFLTPTYSGGFASFQAQRAQELTGLTFQFGPIQSGTGDPSPENIRPISGRTGLTVMTAGRNLLPKNTTLTPTTSNGITFSYNADGSITANGTATGVAMSRAVSFRLPFGNYRKSDRILVQYKESNWRTVTGGGPTSNFMTIDEDIELACRISIASGTTVDNVTYYPYIYLESETSTEYEPYAGAYYPIAWETEAGTVYGGNLDVVSGVLTVDRVCKSFDGTEEGWTKAGGTSNNTQRYYITWENMDISGVANPSDAICSHLVFLSGNSGAFGTFNCTVTNFAVKDGNGSQFADLTAFTTWLAAQNTAGTPLQLCVELAESITYQLDPEEVQTLAGYNQIYADTGAVLDVEF